MSNMNGTSTVSNTHTSPSTSTTITAKTSKKRKSKTTQKIPSYKVRKILKPYLIPLQEKMKYTLVTIRFNSETYEENKRFRERNRDKFGCIYGIPGLNTKIDVNKPMYVLEMNNTENRIMGIGCIEYRPINKKVFLHKIGNYNRYIFVGKYRIDRSEMSESQEKAMESFDKLCFKYPSHLKRGQGFIIFPTILIYIREYYLNFNMVTYISDMFHKRYTTPNKNT